MLNKKLASAIRQDYHPRCIAAVPVDLDAIIKAIEESAKEKKEN